MAATTGNTQGRVGGGTHMKPQNQTEHNIHYAKCEVVLLTLLCTVAAYYCRSLHRKRTGQ
ncbi:hypothetical protein BRM00_22875 [Xanthomonas oryzae pv. oryzae]|nr:hypothetical protein BRM00_22875 [Xanthomonas oryzae pv. oryzae]